MDVFEENLEVGNELVIVDMASDPEPGVNRAHQQTLWAYRQR